MATRQQVLDTIRDTREFKGYGPEAQFDLMHATLTVLLDIRHLLDSTSYYETDDSAAAGEGEPIQPPAVSDLSARKAPRAVKKTRASTVGTKTAKGGQTRKRR